MATNKPETSGPAFGRSPTPYKPGQTTPVSMPNMPPKPTTPAVTSVVEDGVEPHPEHVAGAKAIDLFSAKTNAEMEAGAKAVAKHPHRFK